MSCKYKDIFGKPNEGVHSSRFLGMAVVDLAATAGIAAIITAAIPSGRKSVGSFLSIFITTLFILMIFAILVHKIFCVDTALNVKIFGKSNTGNTSQQTVVEDIFRTNRTD